MSTLTTSTRSGVELITINDFLWRVTASDGRVLGHIERSNTAQGDIHIAKRYAPARSRFESLGQFWNVDDAVDCLHSF